VNRWGGTHFEAVFDVAVESGAADDFSPVREFFGQRVVGGDTPLDGGFAGVVAGKSGGVDDDLFDHSGGSQSNDRPVESTVSPAPSHPTVFGCRRLAFDQTFSAANRLVVSG